MILRKDPTDTEGIEEEVGPRAVPTPPTRTSEGRQPRRRRETGPKRDRCVGRRVGGGTRHGSPSLCGLLITTGPRRQVVSENPHPQIYGVEREGSPCGRDVRTDVTEALNGVPE